MSLILDALKRSEAERQATADGPRTAHRVRNRPGTLRPALIAVALLATGIGLFVAWQAGQLATGPQTAAPATAPARTIEPSVGVQRPDSADPTGQSAPVDEEPPVVTAETARRGAPDQADTASSREVEDDSVAVVVDSTPPAAPTLVEPETIERAAPTPRTATPATVEAAYLPLETLGDSPVRRDLMALTVNMHVYAEDPADRFVLVDLQRRQEGDDLMAGVRLVEITPEGSVVEIRGERYLWRYR